MLYRPNARLLQVKGAIASLSMLSPVWKPKFDDIDLDTTNQSGDRFLSFDGESL
ncbi:MAG TPA: hypothetical protein V6D09_24495 [Leptolyngbyaceae cyanobacterium]